MNINSDSSIVKSANIPQELKNLPNWLLWKYGKPKNGKPTKPPYGALTGIKADPTAPKDWTAFDVALSAYNEGNYAGIGFGFQQKDGLTGVDLDDVRNPVTGEIIPWAEKLIAQFDTYAEISPSGTGVKLFARGTIPTGIKTKQIEIYAKDRYFTVTGQVLSGHTAINDRQEALDELLKTIPDVKADDKLLREMLKSDAGDNIRSLFNGDFSSYPSQSEADLAFCNYLAFWTGNDTEQVDRIFHHSWLYRKKWDEKHFSNGNTYGEETISKAVQKEPLDFGNDFDDPPEKPAKGPKALTLSELEKEYSKEIEWLYKTHIPQGMPIIINGREGDGKTSIVLQICKDILAEHTAGYILWLATEGAVVDTLQKTAELGLKSNRFLIAQKADESFRFDFYLKGDRQELSKILKGIGSRVLLVVIDSIRGMSRLSENDANLGQLIGSVNEIVCDKYRAALVYIDHMSKSKKELLLDRNSGTTSKTSQVRAVLSVLPVSKYKRKICIAKQNIAKLGTELESIKTNTGIIIRESQDAIAEETQKDKAEEFLIQLFTENKTVRATDVYGMGAFNGFSSTVLQNAKKTLGLSSMREDKNSPWFWGWKNTPPENAGF